MRPVIVKAPQRVGMEALAGIIDLHPRMHAAVGQRRHLVLVDDPALGIQALQSHEGVGIAKMLAAGWPMQLG